MKENPTLDDADYFFDTTFCVSPNCTCGKKLTAEVVNDAKILWAAMGMDDGPRMAMAYRCGKPDGAPNITEARPEWVETLFNAPVSPPRLPPLLHP
jgi:hypothetical protein